MSGLRVRTAAEKAERAAHRAYVTGKPVEDPKTKQVLKRKHQAEKSPRQREKRVKKARNAGPSIETLDDLFSRLVRATANYECQFWGVDGITCSTQMQCMHLKSRRFRNIRWRSENAACGCAAHHRFYTDHPDLFFKAVERLWPGRWDEVQRLWNSAAAPKCGKDRGDLADRLRAELKRIERGAA